MTTFLIKLVDSLHNLIYFEKKKRKKKQIKTLQQNKSQQNKHINFPIEIPRRQSNQHNH